MIGIDAKPYEARLLTTFEALNTKLAAEGVSAKSVAAEKKQLQDLAKPLDEVSGQVSTLLTAAQKVSFPGMTPAQQELARAALTAAEALEKSTASVVEDVKGYRGAAQLCDTMLQTMLGVEKAATGYKSQYAWSSPENSSYSSEHTDVQVGRISALLQSAPAIKDSVVKRAVEAHRPELEAMRAAAAELALVEVIRKGFENMLYKEQVKLGEIVGWMMAKVATAAPFVSDATLSDMVARFVQVTTAIAHTSKKGVASYAANPGKSYVDADTQRRLESVLGALVAEPAKAGDPADLFVSEQELQKLAGVEGGMVKSDAPPRPDIPASDVADMAKALLQSLVVYQTR